MLKNLHRLPYGLSVSIRKSRAIWLRLAAFVKAWIGYRFRTEMRDWSLSNPRFSQFRQLSPQQVLKLGQIGIKNLLKKAARRQIDLRLTSKICAIQAALFQAELRA